MQPAYGLRFYRRIHPKQWIKWTVYTVLLVNWGFYILLDWENASFTLRTGGSLYQWTTAFATSLDEAAWFGLLFLWELETYVLSEEADTPVVQRLSLAMRLVCYVFIANTVVARFIVVNELRLLEPLTGISSLCQLADQQTSFTRNLEYTVIDTGNCTRLSPAREIFQVNESAVTDAPGLHVERISAWVDLQDSITWLLIMLTIEIAIWLQEREITGGPVMFVSHAGKLLYGLLFAHAAYWAYRGHWLYSWDQIMWIGGFFAIELNVRDWNREISAHEEI
jgi:hypothetical protein